MHIRQRMISFNTHAYVISMFFKECAFFIFSQIMRDFACHKGFATTWAFVFKQDAIASIHAIGFAVNR